MRETWGRIRALFSATGVSGGATLLLICAMAAPAQASIGYEPDAVKPQIGLGAQVPHGVAIDQGSQQIYVAVPVHEFSFDLRGEVLQLQSNGTPTANSPFLAGSTSFFGGVAVNPVTQNVYASRGIVEPPFGKFGEPRMHVISPSGSEVSSFALANPTATAPQIATDSLGRVYYPNPATHAVEVFNSAGALQSTITCADCPLGPFDAPASVAVDGSGNVYVADMDKDFAVKLKSASLSFAFERQFQSGLGAAAIAVDSVTGDVFVGDLPGGKTNYHITAYNSSGVQFDDFAAGMTKDPPSEGGKILAPQIAVNTTTHDLYVTDQSRLLVFERTTIDPPAVTTSAASGVGQLNGTLNATVNANGHAVLECEFEYTDHADFLANEYANATVLPCSSKPNTMSPTPVSASVTGLSPSTTYHYRTAASSHAGSTQGGDQTFTTLPSLPPTVTAEPPVGVTQTSALLRGKVNPRGGMVSDCHFEFGPSTSYGTSFPCASLPGPVSTEVAQGHSVLGLTPGSTYHYRLVATSNAGTTKGGDFEFTTASPPPPSSTPSDPPKTDTPPPPTATPPGSAVPPVATPRPKPLRCKKGLRKKRVRGKLRCVKKPKKRTARRSQAR